MPHSGSELLTRPAAPGITPANVHAPADAADADTDVCSVSLQPFAAKMAQAGLPS